MLDVTKIVTGRWNENCYVVSSFAGDSVVVDPGGDFETIARLVAPRRLTIHAVINTHGHYDHLGAVADVVEAYHVPFYLHPGDEDLLKRANFYRKLFLGEDAIRVPSIDVQLAGESVLEFGSLQVTVVHTPGHTPGSVTFDISGRLFTGDTLMAQHIGRTDLPGGDRAELLASVELLAERYPEATVLHPGHGEDAVLGDVLTRVSALTELR